MAALNSVTDLSYQGDVGIITVNSPPVNTLSSDVRIGMGEGFKQTIENTACKAIILICEGRTFFAGADIGEFGGGMRGITLFDLQDMIEDAPKPVIAAIHGTALGGGLEVALCCHYRVAVPSAKCGLPEVNLGLLPGAGGTQRLPRIVGIEQALEMVTSGSHMGAAQCLAMGLIDEIMPEGLLRDAAVNFARRVLTEGKPLRKVRDMTEKLQAPANVFEKFRASRARKFRGFKAPEANIKAIEAAATLPFSKGILKERELFLELIVSPESAAQRYVFFAERQAAKIPDLPRGTPPLPLAQIGVIGAGTMGGGIAMNFLNAGFPVTLVEANKDALDRGLAIIRKNYENSAKSGRFSENEVRTRLALLTPSLAMEDVSRCDLIVEAVFEDMAIKKDIFRALDKIAKSDAILASNTSYLDINEIASVVRQPQNVIGMHFFSPANVMRLLEVVRGDKTSHIALATTMQMAKKIGKVAVLVGVCYGFVGNRMLFQRQREANRLVLEGVMPWDVDRVLYDFGFPMGPFAMADMAGLDIGWDSATSRSSSLREILCEQNRRGQKTRAGFYDYDETRSPKPSAVTEQIIRDLMQKQGKSARNISDEEIVERCIYPMINEAAKILEEGKAIRASDIDVIWVNGYGWPTWRGGPMYYADQIGPAKILERMQNWQSTMSDDFRAATLLEKLVHEKKQFSDL